MSGEGNITATGAALHKLARTAGIAYLSERGTKNQELAYEYRRLYYQDGSVSVALLCRDENWYDVKTGMSVHRTCASTWWDKLTHGQGDQVPPISERQSTKRYKMALAKWEGLRLFPSLPFESVRAANRYVIVRVNAAFPSQGLNNHGNPSPFGIVGRQFRSRDLALQTIQETAALEEYRFSYRLLDLADPALDLTYHGPKVARREYSA